MIATGLPINGTTVFVGVGELTPSTVTVGAGADVPAVAVSVGVGDSVSAADVAVRKEAKVVWDASA